MAYPAEKLLSVMKEQGLTLLEAAERFGVGTANVSRWKHNTDPSFVRNKPGTKIDRAALAQDLAGNPDDFFYEWAARFSVSLSGMGSAVKGLGFSRKKKPKADAEARAVFTLAIKDYEDEGRPLVDVDQSGFTHDSRRAPGYSTVGKRC
jgi:transcriptional regulator with XRE-family HTH domain